jgi:hypothetical protein
MRFQIAHTFVVYQREGHWKIDHEQQSYHVLSSDEAKDPPGLFGCPSLSSCSQLTIRSILLKLSHPKPSRYAAIGRLSCLCSRPNVRPSLL